MSADRASNRSLAALTAVMFMTSMATLAQSYVALKAVFLVLFLIASVGIVLRNRVVIHQRLVSFYLLMCIAGIVWVLIGLLHQSNHVIGAFDALRLYSAWSVAFLLLYTLLRAEPSLDLFHRAFVTAGILISAINLIALYDQFAGTSLLPDAFKTELELFIGIHDGYIQITSQNIGALFLIVPYLLTLQLRSDAGTANSRLAKVSLLMSLTLAAVSGRRALWLVVALTPITILLLASLTGSLSAIRARARPWLAVYCVVAVLGAGMVSVLPARWMEAGYMQHLQAAFSAQDERSIQKGFLVSAFEESPVLGSGFGAYAGYSRSDDRPWTYELTYHQMLFNLGIVGTAFMTGLFALYAAFAIRILRRYHDCSAIPFALLVALGSLLFGAYSNPYLRSFDFLFFVGLLPYLSTFQRGFEESALRFDTRSVLQLVPRHAKPSVPRIEA